MRTKVNKITKWNQIEWKPIEKKIFRMQQKIFQASRQNERNKMFTPKEFNTIILGKAFQFVK